MQVTHFERPMWTLYRFTLGDYEGQISDAASVGDYWDKRDADAECARLMSVNDDTEVFYEVIEGTAGGVYPADESPPWVDDPERFRKRGYEERSIRDRFG